MKNKLLHIAEGRLQKGLWALFVLLLPLTSVPMIVHLVHSDVVAAPSALLLPFLMLLLAIPFVILRQKFPDAITPLVFFVLVSLISTAISFFYQIPAYKDNDPFRSSANAVLTMFIGFSFYLVSILTHQKEGNLRFTFQLVNISGAAVCLWTLTQAFFWYRFQRYPEWMKTIQFTLSIGSLYRQRFVGFTLEPSWLAHQLNLLYLPYWFAASVTGYSAFPFRFKFLTVERVLFASGITVLFLTLSRVGLAAFLITAAFCAIIFVQRIVKKLAGTFPKEKQRIMTFALYGLILFLLAAAAYGILRLLMKLDFRMAGLFDIQFRGRSDPVFYIAEKLSLAARFVYWDGGLSIFNAYPLLGVGTGHAGYYLPSLLNDYAFRLVEVRDLLYHSNTLLNIKSLWIRILAESGIIGFTFFFVWYLRSFFTSAAGLQEKNVLKSTAAWMGCFTLLAFILEGFSLDTYALPYLWFSAGLSAGALNIQEGTGEIRL